MGADPIDRLGDLVGQYVARVEGYAEVVVDAARRNADGTYDAEQLLDTVQTLAERALRDTARAATYLLDAFVAAVPAAPADEAASPPEG